MLLKRRMVRVAAGIVLAVAGLAVLPAVSASASTNAVAYWQLPSNSGVMEVSYPCYASTTHTYQGLALTEVRNHCGYRVWLHAYNSSSQTIASYCLNPGGSVAYHFSAKYTQLQISSNTSQCDPGSFFALYWEYSIYYQNCQMGVKYTWSGHWVGDVVNGCNFRIWIHQYTNGTGKSLCVSPGTEASPITLPVNEYLQVQQSYNQVPCADGPPPY